MKKHVIERFPEHAERIEVLHGSSSVFEALCREYGRAVEALRRHDIPGMGNSPQPGEGLDPEALRRRRAALEEELLLAINTSRV